MGHQLSRLGAKFSLLLALVWFLGGSVTIFTLSQHLNAQAEQTIRERADIVLSATQAARNYTQNNIQPLIRTQATYLQNSDSEASNSEASDLETSSVLEARFIQEIIPNFAARSIFDSFRQQDPSLLDYSYKEAAINPTNPEDLADSFEAQLYPQLQPLNGPLAESVAGYRTLAGKKLFYLAQPLVMKDASCLACHGNPADAPKAFLDMYGDHNGFGWDLNQVVATQMVYVPADTIFARGRQSLWTVTKTLLSIFGALFVVINLLLWRNVVRPLAILTGTAKQIGQCSISADSRSSPKAIHQKAILQKNSSQKAIDLKESRLNALTQRKDEPGQLARAFEYMLYVLNQREQDLQQAVNERTRSLQEEMRDRQAAQSALQTYTHAMNHDLRNIAMGISSIIQGFLFRQDSIQQTQSGQGEAKVTVDVEAIALIQNSCDRQLKLMDTLMQARSADTWRATLQYASVSLHQLTSRLLSTYAATPNTSTVTLTNRIPPDLPPVWGDASQLQRVLTNLIGNALKYNSNGVNVVVSASIIQAEIVLCRVSDDGYGLKTANFKTLFEPYHRSSPNTAGYGLGLYICREIIRAHGGDIGVDSTARKGAAFWFTLPLSEFC